MSQGHVEDNITGGLLQACTFHSSLQHQWTMGIKWNQTERRFINKTVINNEVDKIREIH